MAVVRIGTTEGNRVVLDVQRREFPHGGYEDRQWVFVDVMIEVGGAWRGRYDAMLRSDEFARFLDDVRAFQSNEHKEEAEFHSMEEWLSLELRLNRKRGLIRVRGEAGDLPGGSGNQFSFEFEVDLQESLPMLANDLEAMLEEFPALL
jgi:hypothetical protein